LFCNYYPFYKWHELNAWILDELALYFFKNPLFERADSPIVNASLKKGLLFSGNVGTGKTLCLEIMSEITSELPRLNPGKFPALQQNRFNIFPTTDIVEKYKEFSKFKDTSEEEIIAQHTRKSFYPKKQGLGRSKLPIIKGFDGLGEEVETGPVNNFGTIVNVMQQIFLSRYRFFLDFGMKTHATTNLARYADFEKHYSTMFADRCVQMFNKIPFLGASNRK